MFEIPYGSQGRNHRENLGASAPMVGRIYHPGWNRVKVSETFGATAVIPIAPVDTSLTVNNFQKDSCISFFLKHNNYSCKRDHKN